MWTRCEAGYYLARVDANNVLQVLPAAQRIGDGLAKAVPDLEEAT